MDIKVFTFDLQATAGAMTMRTKWKRLDYLATLFYSSVACFKIFVSMKSLLEVELIPLNLKKQNW